MLEPSGPNFAPHPITSTMAEKLFGHEIVKQCCPFGFERKLGWYFVKDLLTIHAKETPNALISQNIFDVFLSDLPSSDLEGCDLQACRSGLLLSRYSDALEVLLTTPSQDRIGAVQLEQLFSLSRAYVHSKPMKMRALDPKARPARWSTSDLIRDLRLASAQTAKDRLIKLRLKQKKLKIQCTVLTKLTTFSG